MHRPMHLCVRGLWTSTIPDLLMVVLEIFFQSLVFFNFYGQISDTTWVVMLRILLPLTLKFELYKDSLSFYIMALWFSIVSLFCFLQFTWIRLYFYFDIFVSCICCSSWWQSACLLCFISRGLYIKGFIWVVTIILPAAIFMCELI